MINSRIIGQLHGGSPVNCIDPANDPGEYGRFDVSWDGLSSTRRLKDWLDPLSTGLSGIDGAYPSPNEEIVGDGYTCSFNEIYTLTNAPSSIYWEFPTNLLTQVSVSGASITLKAIDWNVRGSATLIAKSTSTNAIIAQKQIYVGKPATPYSNISGSTNVSYGSVQDYDYYGTVAGVTSYTWWLPYPYIKNGNIVVSPLKWTRLNGTGTTKYLYSQVGPNDGLVQFMGVNKCGVGGAKIMNVYVNGGGGPMPTPPPINDEILELDINDTRFLVYPNPSNNSLFLVIDPELRKNILGIYLFDMNGKKVYHSNNSSLDNIDISKYSSGIYILNIKGKNESINKRIIINK